MRVQDQKNMIHASTKHPSDVDICSILGLSRQSTFSEIKHAFEAQRAELLRVEARDDVEAALLQEKMQMLEGAFAQHSNVQRPIEWNARPNAKPGRAKRRTYTTYSFYIPCIFALISRCADGAMHWLCSCCAGEANEDPCEPGCFTNMFSCTCVRAADTVIAIAAIIAGLVWGVRKLIPGTKSFMEGRRRQRSIRKQEAARSAFEDRYKEEYFPKLDMLYSNWTRLREYNLDVLPFLKRIQERKTIDIVDSDFDRMIASTENAYRRLEEFWQVFCDYRRELSNDENGEFYRYMRDDSPDRNKYHGMFMEPSAPWRAQG